MPNSLSYAWLQVHNPPKKYLLGSCSYTSCTQRTRPAGIGHTPHRRDATDLHAAQAVQPFQL